MLYIDAENFDIVLGNSFLEYADTFECDDYIAPIVSKLNKKGYFTEYSCQGHVSTSRYEEEYVGHKTFKFDTKNAYDYTPGYIMFKSSVKNISFKGFPFDRWTVELQEYEIDEDGNEQLVLINPIYVNSEREFKKLTKEGNYKIIIRDNDDLIKSYIEVSEDANDDGLYLMMNTIMRDWDLVYTWSDKLVIKK